MRCASSVEPTPADGGLRLVGVVHVASMILNSVTQEQLKATMITFDRVAEPVAAFAFLRVVTRIRPRDEHAG